MRIPLILLLTATITFSAPTDFVFKITTHSGKTKITNILKTSTITENEFASEATTTGYESLRNKLDMLLRKLSQLGHDDKETTLKPMLTTTSIKKASDITTEIEASINSTAPDTRKTYLTGGRATFVTEAATEPTSLANPILLEINSILAASPKNFEIFYPTERNSETTDTKNMSSENSTDITITTARLPASRTPKHSQSETETITDQEDSEVTETPTIISDPTMEPTEYKKINYTLPTDKRDSTNVKDHVLSNSISDTSAFSDPTNRTNIDTEISYVTITERSDSETVGISTETRWTGEVTRDTKITNLTSTEPRNGMSNTTDTLVFIGPTEGATTDTKVSSSSTIDRKVSESIDVSTSRVSGDKATTEANISYSPPAKQGTLENTTNQGVSYASLSTSHNQPTLSEFSYSPTTDRSEPETIGISTVAYSIDGAIAGTKITYSPPAEQTDPNRIMDHDVSEATDRPVFMGPTNVVMTDTKINSSSNLDQNMSESIDILTSQDSGDEVTTDTNISYSTPTEQRQPKWTTEYRVSKITDTTVLIGPTNRVTTDTDISFSSTINQNMSEGIGVSISQHSGDEATTDTKNTSPPSGQMLPERITNYGVSEITDTPAFVRSSNGVTTDTEVSSSSTLDLNVSESTGLPPSQESGDEATTDTNIFYPPLTEQGTTENTTNQGISYATLSTKKPTSHLPIESTTPSESSNSPTIDRSEPEIMGFSTVAYSIDDATTDTKTTYSPPSEQMLPGRITNYGVSETTDTSTFMSPTSGATTGTEVSSSSTMHQNVSESTDVSTSRESDDEATTDANISYSLPTKQGATESTTNQEVSYALSTYALSTKTPIPHPTIESTTFSEFSNSPTIGRREPKIIGISTVAYSIDDATTYTKITYSPPSKPMLPENMSTYGVSETTDTPAFISPTSGVTTDTEISLSSTIGQNAAESIDVSTSQEPDDETTTDTKITYPPSTEQRQTEGITDYDVSNNTETPVFIGSTEGVTTDTEDSSSSTIDHNMSEITGVSTSRESDDEATTDTKITYSPPSKPMLPENMSTYGVSETTDTPAFISPTSGVTTDTEISLSSTIGQNAAESIDVSTSQEPDDETTTDTKITYPPSTEQRQTEGITDYDVSNNTETPVFIGSTEGVTTDTEDSSSSTIDHNMSEITGVSTSRESDDEATTDTKITYPPPTEQRQTDGVTDYDMSKNTDTPVFIGTTEGVTTDTEDSSSSTIDQNMSESTGVSTSRESGDEATTHANITNSPSSEQMLPVGITEYRMSETTDSPDSVGSTEGVTTDREVNSLSTIDLNMPESTGVSTSRESGDEETRDTKITYPPPTEQRQTEGITDYDVSKNTYTPAFVGSTEGVTTDTEDSSLSTIYLNMSETTGVSTSRESGDEATTDANITYSPSSKQMLPEGITEYRVSETTDTSLITDYGVSKNTDTPLFIGSTEGVTTNTEVSTLSTIGLNVSESTGVSTSRESDEEATTDTNTSYSTTTKQGTTENTTNQGVSYASLGTTKPTSHLTIESTTPSESSNLPTIDRSEPEIMGFSTVAYSIDDATTDTKITYSPPLEQMLPERTTNYGVSETTDTPTFMSPTSGATTGTEVSSSSTMHQNVSESTDVSASRESDDEATTDANISYSLPTKQGATESTTNQEVSYALSTKTPFPHPTIESTTFSEFSNSPTIGRREPKIIGISTVTYSIDDATTDTKITYPPSTEQRQTEGITDYDVSKNTDTPVFIGTTEGVTTDTEVSSSSTIGLNVSESTGVSTSRESGDEATTDANISYSPPTKPGATENTTNLEVSYVSLGTTKPTSHPTIESTFSQFSNSPTIDRSEPEIMGFSTVAYSIDEAKTDTKITYPPPTEQRQTEEITDYDVSKNTDTPVFIASTEGVTTDTDVSLSSTTDRSMSESTGVSTSRESVDEATTDANITYSPSSEQMLPVGITEYRVSEITDTPNYVGSTEGVTTDREVSSLSTIDLNMPKSTGVSTSRESNDEVTADTNISYPQPTKERATENTQNLEVSYASLSTTKPTSHPIIESTFSEFSNSPTIGRSEPKIIGISTVAYSIDDATTDAKITFSPPSERLLPGRITNSGISETTGTPALIGSTEGVTTDIAVSLSSTLDQNVLESIGVSTSQEPDDEAITDTRITYPPPTEQRQTEGITDYDVSKNTDTPVFIGTTEGVTTDTGDSSSSTIDQKMSESTGVSTSRESGDEATTDTNISYSPLTKQGMTENTTNQGISYASLGTTKPTSHPTIESTTPSESSNSPTIDRSEPEIIGFSTVAYSIDDATTDTKITYSPPSEQMRPGRITNSGITETTGTPALCSTEGVTTDTEDSSSSTIDQNMSEGTGVSTSRESGDEATTDAHITNSPSSEQMLSKGITEYRVSETTDSPDSVGSTEGVTTDREVSSLSTIDLNMLESTGVLTSRESGDEATRDTKITNPPPTEQRQTEGITDYDVSNNTETPVFIGSTEEVTTDTEDSSSSTIDHNMSEITGVSTSRESDDEATTDTKITYPPPTEQRQTDGITDYDMSKNTDTPVFIGTTEGVTTDTEDSSSSTIDQNMSESTGVSTSRESGDEATTHANITNSPSSEQMLPVGITEYRMSETTDSPDSVGSTEGVTTDREVNSLSTIDLNMPESISVSNSRESGDEETRDTKITYPPPTEQRQTEGITDYDVSKNTYTPAFVGSTEGVTTDTEDSSLSTIYLNMSETTGVSTSRESGDEATTDANITYSPSSKQMLPEGITEYRVSETTDTSLITDYGVSKNTDTPLFIGSTEGVITDTEVSTLSTIGLNVSESTGVSTSRESDEEATTDTNTSYSTTTKQGTTENTTNQGVSYASLGTTKPTSHPTIESKTPSEFSNSPTIGRSEPQDIGISTVAYSIDDATTDPKSTFSPPSEQMPPGRFTNSGISETTGTPALIDSTEGVTTDTEISLSSTIDQNVLESIGVSTSQEPDDEAITDIRINYPPPTEQRQTEGITDYGVSKNTDTPVFIGTTEGVTTDTGDSSSSTIDQNMSESTGVSTSRESDDEATTDANITYSPSSEQMLPEEITEYRVSESTDTSGITDYGVSKNIDTPVFIGSIEGITTYTEVSSSSIMGLNVSKSSGVSTSRESDDEATTDTNISYSPPTKQGTTENTTNQGVSYALGTTKPTSHPTIESTTFSEFSNSPTISRSEPQIIGISTVAYSIDDATADTKITFSPPSEQMLPGRITNSGISETTGTPALIGSIEGVTTDTEDSSSSTIDQNMSENTGVSTSRESGDEATTDTNITYSPSSKQMLPMGITEYHVSETTDTPDSVGSTEGVTTDREVSSLSTIDLNKSESTGVSTSGESDDEATTDTNISYSPPAKERATQNTTNLEVSYASLSTTKPTSHPSDPGRISEQGMSKTTITPIFSNPANRATAHTKVSSLPTINQENSETLGISFTSSSADEEIADATIDPTNVTITTIYPTPTDRIESETISTTEDSINGTSTDTKVSDTNQSKTESFTEQGLSEIANMPAFPTPRNGTANLDVKARKPISSCFDKMKEKFLTVLCCLLELNAS